MDNQNKWEHISERALDFVLDNIHTLNDLTPKIRCRGRNGVDPNLIFGLESKLFLEKGRNKAVVTHNDEVETVTIFRASTAGRRNSHGHDRTGCDCHTEVSGSSVNHYLEDVVEHAVIEEEVLINALTFASKETVWRIKGFVRLKGGVHILNWAFGRYELTVMEGPSDDEETVRFTVMGERGEVRRVACQLSVALGAEIY
jgi:G3E family GTPase